MKRKGTTTGEESRELMTEYVCPFHFLLQWVCLKWCAPTTVYLVNHVNGCDFNAKCRSHGFDGPDQNIQLQVTTFTGVALLPDEEGPSVSD